MSKCLIWWCPAETTGDNGECLVHAFARERTGNPLGIPQPTLEERFWMQVDKTGEHWLWTGNLPDGRYGRFFTRGTTGSKRMMMAHRYSYELVNGPIPSGLFLDHLCRITTCVRPDHLEAVTPRENTMRGWSPAAVNDRKTQCPHGHPYDEVNTGHSNGQRLCLTCRREASREFQRRKNGREHLYGLPPVRGSEKTHCPSGHEYTPENTRTYNGKRQCKACGVEAMRRFRAKQK